MRNVPTSEKDETSVKACTQMYEWRIGVILPLNYLIYFRSTYLHVSKISPILSVTKLSSREYTSRHAGRGNKGGHSSASGGYLAHIVVETL